MDNTILVKCWHRIVQCRACQFHWIVRNEYRSKEEERERERKKTPIDHRENERFAFYVCFRERIYTIIDSLRPEIKVNFHLHITPKLSASMGTSFLKTLFPISWNSVHFASFSLSSIFCFVLQGICYNFCTETVNSLFVLSLTIIYIYIETNASSISQCVCIFLFSSFVREHSINLIENLCGPMCQPLLFFSIVSIKILFFSSFLLSFFLFFY